MLDLCFAVLAFLVIETLHTQISSLFLGKDGTASAYQVSGDYMRWIGYFFIFMGIKMATDGVPVSYTHLDVYKRQFVLWVGNRRMIKRRIFDEYIEQMYSI